MPVTRETLDAIREVIKEEVVPKLDKLEEKIDEIKNIKDTLVQHTKSIQDIEKSIQETDRQLKEFKEKTIPDLEKKCLDMTVKTCLNNLDLDTHRRKWTLILNGIQGEAGEQEKDTRTKVRDFASKQLKVAGVDHHGFAACHRLAQTQNAGIIVRFLDLAHRNSWLSNAKNMKNSSSKVSLSPDLHPCLRPLKSDILKARRNLPPEQKRVAQIRYMPSWPYVCLKIRGRPTVTPAISKETIVNSYLEKNG